MDPKSALMSLSSKTLRIPWKNVFETKAVTDKGSFFSTRPAVSEKYLFLLLKQLPFYTLCCSALPENAQPLSFVSCATLSAEQYLFLEITPLSISTVFFREHLKLSRKKESSSWPPTEQWMEFNNKLSSFFQVALEKI